MDLPSLPAGHKLRPVLRAALGTSANLAPSVASHQHWDAAYFGLDRTHIFQDASEEDRARILDAAGRALLEEAYFIEKSGVAFAAKMVLLSETTEERLLYALFAADEASHFSAVRRFLVREPEAPEANPFLSLLSGVIENGNRATLQFVIQVVLEGWGLEHYRSLRNACASEALRPILDGILADEAAHHGSGRVLFDGADVDAATKQAILDVLRPLLRMVQAGPQTVVAAVEGVLGHLSRAQRVRLLEELDGEAHSLTRLTQLRSLMRGERARDIVEALDAQNAFVPLSYEDCA
ncbi:MAG TPA: ferritin-like domain-containing protein [Labilithrix sp.]|jgi:hypothetical protein|nr:ferritin-like domain-containing protein [Labilithrix sp.]